MKNNKSKTTEYIYVPCGDRKDPLIMKAKVIYRTKSALWAVTRLITNPITKESAITYIGDEQSPSYGLKITQYRPIYYKGLQVSERPATQKELIKVCRLYNSKGITAERLLEIGKDKVIREQIRQGTYGF